MDPLRWHSRPALEAPVLVAAFEGWNDAGEAATLAVGHLADEVGATAFAAIDPEEFHDFTETRPTVRLRDDGSRALEWPSHTFSAAATPAGGVVVLRAVEPQLRWRTYTEAVVEVARTMGCRLVVTLGALLTDTPHTRPVRVTGTAQDAALAARLGLSRSRYEGPTGIVGVLNDALGRDGIPSASLWAGVPHYLGRSPAPAASLALVERTATLLGMPVDVSALEEASTEWLAEVDQAVRDDDEASAYVASLEAAEDQEADPDDGPGAVGDVDAEGLAAEAERFLREQGRG